MVNAWQRERLLRVGLPALAIAMLAGMVAGAAMSRSEPVAHGLPVLSKSPPATLPATPSPTATPTTAAPTTAPAMISRPPAPPSRTPSPSRSQSPSPSHVPVRCDVTRFPKPYSDGSISGVVTDTAGRPVAGAVVYSPPACGGHEPRPGVNRTDAQGRFALPCSSELPSWVVVSPFVWYTGVRVLEADLGFAWLDGELGQVPCGSSRHSVVLPPGGTLDVRVVDAQGQPVADTVVAVDHAPSGEDFLGPRTDAQGRVTVRGLAAGGYHVTPAAGTGGHTLATVRAAQTTSITVVLAIPSPSPTPSATPSASAS